MSRTVAIVEDEPAIRANYTEALRRHGYAVQPHASRAEAQAAFALKLPDLVIIDVGLGDEPEGGFDLCRELRARSATLPQYSLYSGHLPSVLKSSRHDLISTIQISPDGAIATMSARRPLARQISGIVAKPCVLSSRAVPRQMSEAACDCRPSWSTAEGWRSGIMRR
jgi:two-component system OmpR family response regulator